MMLFRNNILAIFAMLILLLACGCENWNQSPSNDESYANLSTKQMVAKFYDGREIFARYCKTCHWPPEKKADDQYVFDELFERWNDPSGDQIVQFLKDSKQVKKSGNKYVIELAKARGSDYEHMFKDSLSSTSFNNLIIYIKVAVRVKSSVK